MSDETNNKCPEFTKSAQQVIQEEKEYIKDDEARDSSYGDKFWGLAISGGGIRSASFGLGVMQALVSTTPKSLLTRIDYLSTVSGGGYIGSALTWFLHKGLPGGGNAGTEPGNFPFGRIGAGGRTDPKGNLILDFIRQHGNYLIPGKGLNAISLIGVAIRSMFVSLFVYLSLLTIIITGLRFIGAFEILPISKIFDTGVTNTLSLVTLLWLAIIIIALLALASFVFSLRTYVAKGKTSRYKRSIYFQKWIGLAWIGVLGLVVIGVLPYIYNWLPEVWRQVSAGSSTFIGAMIGFLEYRKAQDPVSAKGGKKSGILIIIAAFALIYGLLLISFNLSIIFLNPWYFIGLVTVTGVLGFFVNLNYVGLHQMYRNRLMETFMPNAMNVEMNQWDPATDADEALLEIMCTKNKDEEKDKDEHTQCKRPYHLINTNIVLVDSPTAKFRGRGGDSFLLSPLNCGSDATCYRETKEYMKKGRRRMTLATSMAISGAAVNPDTGAAGKGVTRNKLVSALLGLLNLRLGYWAQNPKLKKRLPFPPNFFVPGLSADILGIGLKEKRLSIELTDGGHFENLGLYELIRRRTDIIIASDAGADPNFHFGDLANAVERVRVDFGVIIRFLPDCDLGGLLPGSATGPEAEKYNLSARSFAIAKIKYPPAGNAPSEPKKEGYLIYIKTTLTRNLTADIYGYKSDNNSFPDQSTADQFFDEKQFEAYRELGYQLTWQMLDEKPSDEGKEILSIK